MGYENDMDISLSREDLIAELKRLRPLIAADDKEKLKAHRQAERDYLKAFRAACREAARWDYETAKKNYFGITINGSNPRYRRPECPVPQVEILDRMLALIDKSSTKRFNISSRGKYFQIYRLLTFDVPTTKAAC